MKKKQITVNPMQTPKISKGDCFVKKGEVYMLCEFGIWCLSLVNLKYGMAWTSPIEVNDTMNVNPVEWDKLKGGGDFTPVNEIEIIVK